MTAASRSLLALVLLSSLAHADTADQTFKRGRELLKAGKFREACEQFEQSQALDPALGTLFNIAQCDAEIGKLASSVAAYREVIAKDTNAGRKKASRAALARVEPRVPHLVLHAAPGTTVQLAGKPVALDTPIAMDFGDHELHAIQGAVSFDQKVTIDQEARTITVELAPPVQTAAPAPAASSSALARPSQPAAPAASSASSLSSASSSSASAASHSHRKTYAVATIAVGGAGLATGVAFGVLARSRWNAAKAVCGGSTTCETQADADAASHLGDQARSRASLSTIFLIAGGAVAATGIVLYATAPSDHELQLAARPATDGATVVLSGHF